MEKEQKGLGRWLSFQDAAAEYAIATPTLRRWVRERRVPFYRRGRLIKFDRNEVIRDVAQSRVPSREEESEVRRGERVAWTGGPPPRGGRGELGKAGAARGAPLGGREKEGKVQ
jgi:excisionase family DNA binding protein